MSTEQISEFGSVVTPCRSRTVTPVAIDGNELETTDPDRLREFKTTLAEDGYQPTTLSVTARFETDCSLGTQAEIDRLRGYVRAAAFLGVSTLEIDVDRVESPKKVQSGLSALAERARREGVSLTLAGSAADAIELSYAA